jgi:hypothetical protein
MVDGWDTNHFSFRLVGDRLRSGGVINRLFLQGIIPKRCYQMPFLCFQPLMQNMDPWMSKNSPLPDTNMEVTEKVHYIERLKFLALQYVLSTSHVLTYGSPRGRN